MYTLSMRNYGRHVSMVLFVPTLRKASELIGVYLRHFDTVEVDFEPRAVIASRTV